MDLSNKTAEVVGTVVVTQKTWIQSHIRKLAHTAEYFLLGIASYFCFGIKSLFIDMSISFLDQCFKGLIPVRHFDFTDFPYDIIGYLSGCFVGYELNKLTRGKLLCKSKENIAG